METTATPIRKAHHGRNVKRLREMLGINQDTIADDLEISQQTMSRLEAKEEIEDEILEKIAKVLKVPVEAIKNFNDETAFSIVANTFSDFKDNAMASAMNYQCSFNPFDKIVELYDKLLQSEKEKVTMLQELLRDRK